MSPILRAVTMVIQNNQSTIMMITFDKKQFLQEMCHE